MNNIRKKVKEKIKKYSNEEYLDGYIKNEFLTDNGNADIFLKIKNKDELFDPRTYGNQLDLNKDVYDFIDNKSSMLDNNICLNIHIMGIELDKSEIEKIKHIINEHYAIELYKIQKEYRRYKSKVFKLLLLGVAFLDFYIAISISFSSPLILEVLGFLFSFTLWEAFDAFIYAMSDLRRERESITQRLLITVDIENKEK